MERSHIAKKLRVDSTRVEKLLWYRLRSKQIDGLKFRRQAPIGKYIVDFVCFEKKLVVEIDGGQHNDSLSDCVRDAWLVTQGFHVLRYWNNQVLSNIEGVLEDIVRHLNTLP